MPRELGHVEHAAEQRRPVERGVLARELEPSGARVGADLAREARDAGHILELPRCRAPRSRPPRCSRCRRRRCASSARSTARRSPRGASANHDSSKRDSGSGAKNGVRSSSRRKLLRSAKLVDAVRVAPDVDVDRGRLGPSAAAARDGDVAQRELPGFARALPIAGQRDCARSANRRRRASSGSATSASASSTVPLADRASLPIEPDRHVAAARLRRHGRRREQARRNGEIDAVEIDRQRANRRCTSRRHRLARRRRRTPAP